MRPSKVFASKDNDVMKQEQEIEPRDVEGRARPGSRCISGATTAVASVQWQCFGGPHQHTAVTRICCASDGQPPLSCFPDLVLQPSQQSVATRDPCNKLPFWLNLPRSIFVDCD